MKKNRGGKRAYLGQFCALLVSIFVIAFFVVKEITLPEEREYGDTTYQSYENSWKLVNFDETGEAVELPCQIEADARRQLLSGDYKYVLETQLEIAKDEDTWMSFSSQKQDIYVYVDDELRLEHNTDNSRPFGKSSPFIRTFIHLTPADYGKTIRIEFVGNNSYTGRLPGIFVGTQLGIFRHIIEQEMRELFVSFGVILLGIASAAIGFVLRNIYKRELPLEPLGWLVFFAGLWVLVESDIKQFMFPNTSMAGEMTFLCLMMLPIFISQYMDAAQQRRYHKWFAPIGYASIANVVICFALQLMEVASLQNLFPITVLLIGANAITFIVTVVIDCIKKQTKSYFLEILGIVGCLFAGFLEVAIYYIVQPESMDGSILCVGLIFMISMSLIKTFQEIRNVDIEKREALELSKAKDNFLANMSHEIRTPINAVLGMNKMILRETNQQVVKEYATDIHNASNNLLSIINEILDFSKVESGKMEITPCTYDLGELLTSVYQLVRSRAEEKGIDLTFAIDPTLPKLLQGDEAKVRQMIVNLLTNGIKYTEHGLVMLKLTGEKTMEDEITLRASVEDTGIGIKPEDMEKLFGSFQRFDEKKNRNIEGTGLGLAITKQFARLMQGEIMAESTYGKGSIFTLILPQRIVEDIPVGAFDKDRHSKLQAEEITQFTCREGHILVVDDVPMNLKVIKGLLKGTGLQIDTALNGQECLKMLQQKKYDLVFLDHMMPGMDGVEVRKEMMKQSDSPNANVPVIMLTANAIFGAKEQYLKQGFADYLAKPVNEEELRHKIIDYMPKQLVQLGTEPVDAGNASSKEKLKEEVSTKEQLEIIGATTKDQTVKDESAKKQRAEEEKMSEQPEVMLNKEEGLTYVGGDEELYLEVLEEYIQDERGKMLEEYLQSEDMKNYQISVHALKSTSYSIGAAVMGDEAKKVEDACKEQNYDYVKAHHGDIIKMYDALVKYLQEVVKQGI
ncbi:MAG: response regulator [Lachnospiraceae bacterium]|nr:response regulator [Lachnospiraceae bacterium]